MMCAADWLTQIKPNCEYWRIALELMEMDTDVKLLHRPFAKLSSGEQTKILLALLFSGENDFLLIDEPTNHLDQNTRNVIKQYLQKKKSFILVSHDRDLLDACIDHVLALNRSSITVEKGNFSSWWENKKALDHFAMQENAKREQEIAILQKSVNRLSVWGAKSENKKIGIDPRKDHDRDPNARAYIGTKSKKMQRRKIQTENRIQQQIEKKEGLLQNIDTAIPLKLYPLKYHKERLVFCRDLTLSYGTNLIIQGFSLDIHQGERVFLCGKNGCGKSTFLKTLCSCPEEEMQIHNGILQIAPQMIISYVRQDTGFLHGNLEQFCVLHNLNKSVFFTILHQLGLKPEQFSQRLETFSEGQKKKVLIAESLATKAHLYVWDEPLNYVDVLSQMQIEEVLLAAKPTMIIVDHDVRFCKDIATRIVYL